MGGGVIAQCSEKNNNEVVILFDPTTETSFKAAQVLESTLKKHLVVKWKDVITLEELEQAVRDYSKNHILIYSFHGQEQGMVITGETISWQNIQQVIEPGASKHHLFLSCHSEGKIKVKGKEIHGQEGAIDYVLSILRTSILLGGITQNNELIASTNNKVFSSQEQLLLRLIAPLEPMWNDNTHWILSDLALRELYTIGWIQTAIGMSQLSLPSRTTLQATYFNPDTTDFPSGNPDLLKDLYNVIELMSEHGEEHVRGMFEKPLYHISSGIFPNINLKLPTSIFDQLVLHLLVNVFDLSATLGDAVDYLHLLTYFDSKSGAVDGNIIYNDPLKGTAVQAIGEFYDSATRIQLSKIHLWGVELSKAAHYIQDQQNPYHTSLVKSDNIANPELPISIIFNLRSTWLAAAQDNELNSLLAAAIYDLNDGTCNHLVELLKIALIYKSANSVIDKLILGTLMTAYLLAAGFNTAITALIIACNPVKVADSLMDTIDAILNFISATADTLNKISNYNTVFNNQHDQIESKVHSGSGGWLTSTWQNSIRTYIQNNRQTFQGQSLAFLTNQREALIQQWIKQSSDVANYFYHTINQYGIDYIDVKTATLTRLQRAAAQTYMLYNSFFIDKVFKTDSDGDGMSDLLEEKIYGTNPNSAVRIHQISITSTFSTAYVSATFKTDRPTSRIHVKVEIFNQDLTKNTYDYYYDDNGQNNLQSLQTFTQQFAIPHNAIHMKVSLIYTEYYYDWTTVQHNSFPQLLTRTYTASQAHVFSSGPFFP